MTSGNYTIICSITDDSERNTQPRLQDTTHISALFPVPGSSLAVENHINETLPICKSEPQTDKLSYVENNVKENNALCSVSTTIPIRKYSLRKKTPQNIIQQVDNDSNGHVDSIESYSDSSSNISNSSFSDTSNEECDYNKKLKSSPINRAKRKQYKCMQCGSVKTRRRFGNNEMFQNHLKLH